MVIINKYWHKIQSVTIHKWLFILFYLVLLLALTINVIKLPFTYTHDSAIYISGAKNIVNGTGFYSLNLNASNGDNDQLAPITQWQPGYSFAIAIAMKAFKITAIDGAFWVNIFSWVVFNLVWLLIFFEIFNQSTYRIVAAILLFISAFSWQFSSFLLSDIFFFMLVSGYVFFILKTITTKKITNQFCFIILSSVLAGMLLLTRYAGLPFVISLFLVLLIMPGITNFKYRSIAIFMALVIILAIILPWYIRNLHVAEAGGMGFWIGNSGTNFTFSRFFFLVNLYLFVSIGTVSFEQYGLVAEIQSYAFLLLIPIVLIGIYYLIIKKRQLLNIIKINVFIVFIGSMLMLYLGEIIFAGLMNPGFSIISGFLRYFAYLQPFTIILLLFLCKLKYNFLENKKFAFKAYLLLLLFIMIIGNSLRTNHVLFKTMPKENKVAVEFEIFSEKLRNTINNNSLIYSNIPYAVYAQTDINCKGVWKNNTLSLVKEEHQKEKKEIFFVAWKNKEFKDICNDSAAIINYESANYAILEYKFDRK
jgi:hypothetical protein